MKQLLISISALLAAAAAGAQTYVECDFSEGIPDSFELIDGDALTPSADMQKLGFKVGTPWVALTPKNESGPVACSTSWYSPAGQSDDWMILPEVTINHADAILRWRAMASDKKHRDGYVVKMAIQPAAGEEEQWTDLLTVPQEENAWTLHTIDLSAHEGQTVRLAFVNNSTDQSRLYIDDIYCGRQTDLRLKTALGRKSFRQRGVPLSGTVVNMGDSELDGYTVTFAFEKGSDQYKTLSQHFTQTLKPGQQVDFTLDSTLTLPFHQTVGYTATAESGTNRYTTSGTVTAYPRHVVCEEGTGTWCGWCVRGIVMLDSLRKTCSDWAIGIAMHSGDPMACGYISEVSHYLKSDGFPCGVVDRMTSCDPSLFIQTGWLACQREPVFVAMQAEAAINTQTRQVSTDTWLWFADNDADAHYRIGYSIIENDVHVGDNSKYSQKNAYSGGASGPMGGYEALPDVVPAAEMWYQDVARGFVDDINGVEGSVPTNITADEEIRFGKQFTLPDGILDTRNVQIVVMLIDQQDGHIVNAVLADMDGATSAISEVTGTTAPGDGIVCDLQGRRLQHRPAKGIYIIDGRKYLVK